MVRMINYFSFYFRGSETLMFITDSFSSQQRAKKAWQNSEGVERNDKLEDSK